MKILLTAMPVAFVLVLVTTGLKHEVPQLWGFVNGLVCYLAGIAIVRAVND